MSSWESRGRLRRGVVVGRRLTGSAGARRWALNGSGDGDSSRADAERAGAGSGLEAERGTDAPDESWGGGFVEEWLPGVSVSKAGTDGVLRKAPPTRSMPLASTTSRKALCRACFNCRRRILAEVAAHDVATVVGTATRFTMNTIAWHGRGHSTRDHAGESSSQEQPQENLLLVHAAPLEWLLWKVWASGVGPTDRGTESCHGVRPPKW